MSIVSYISQQPVDDFGLPFATLKYSATLAASTDTTLTIPGLTGFENNPSFPGSHDFQYYKAIIKSTAVAWVALNTAATLPAGATFAATSSEMVNLTVNVCRDVKAGDVLHFISASTASISVVLYGLKTPG